MMNDEIKNTTIRNDIQETNKILREMECALDEFAQVINGSRNADKKTPPVDASSLWDEARMMTAQSYENLQKLLEIRNAII